MESIFPGLTSAPNLHPMMVHFPIAFWVAATGAWIVAVVRRNEGAWRFGLWLHTLGLAGAVGAAAFGFWATNKMGHDLPGHDLVHVHRDYMLIATGIAMLITVVGWWHRDAGGRRRFVLAATSLVLLTIMGLGADRGAELVYRHGVGVSAELRTHTTHEPEHSHDDGDVHVPGHEETQPMLEAHHHSDHQHLSE